MKVTKQPDQDFINHIGICLDASGSMGSLQRQVIELTDGQIKHLAASSEANNQETRASVVSFAEDIECLYYDKDVMRMQSIQGKYNIRGMTALCSAALKCIEDLEQTPKIYGLHSFLIFVITDGEDNASPRADVDGLKRKLDTLPAEWTIAFLVPNARGRAAAIRLGVSPGNIEIWDASAKGVVEVGERLKTVTSNYMSMRSTDSTFRGTTNIFNLDPKTVKAAVQTGGLVQLKGTDYHEFPVKANRDGSKVIISDFIEKVTGVPYRLHSTFYQLGDKKVPVQAQKRVAIRNKKTRAVYIGQAARDMLGLPNATVRIQSDYNKDFDIFIESTSTNRILFPGTDVLYLP